MTPTKRLWSDLLYLAGDVHDEADARREKLCLVPAPADGWRYSDCQAIRGLRSATGEEV